ncbi:hypothetical protein EC912_107153, partial [Luteibacter rhizovicinus]
MDKAPGGDLLRVARDARTGNSRKDEGLPDWGG